MVPREYETDREEPQRLKLSKATRDAGGRIEERSEGSPKVSLKFRPFWYIVFCIQLLCVLL